MKKQAEGPKTPENAFPGLMDAKESISGLISEKKFLKLSPHFALQPSLIIIIIYFILKHLIF